MNAAADTLRYNRLRYIITGLLDRDGLVAEIVQIVQKGFRRGVGRDEKGRVARTRAHATKRCAESNARIVRVVRAHANPTWPPGHISERQSTFGIIKRLLHTRVRVRI